MMHTQRHSHNPNLHLHFEKYYCPEPGVQLPVMLHRGPLVSEYLDDLYRVIKQALTDHRRVLACRFDLTLPEHCPLPVDAYTNGPINRFFKSIKTKLQYERIKRNCPHRSPLRYVRVRELSQDGMPHYHVLLLLNLNAYNTPGSVTYEKGRNLFWMVAEAWASALQLPVADAVGRVHYARWKRDVENFNCKQELSGSYFWLEPKDNYARLPHLFERASYMCKADGKSYGDHHRHFGTSRF